LRRVDLIRLRLSLTALVRQAHNVKIVHASRTYVNLDFNNIGVNSIHGGADCFKEYSEAGRGHWMEHKPISDYKRGARPPKDRFPALDGEGLALKIQQRPDIPGIVWVTRESG
jgi:hypothetical protein